MRVPASGPPREGRPAALVAALTRLAEATEALTVAVERRDLAGLTEANERSNALRARVDELMNELTEADRGAMDVARILVLRERLAVAARRNAFLIERAWALDAATMRLLASLGRHGPESPVAAYAPAPGAVCLDRQA